MEIFELKVALWFLFPTPKGGQEPNQEITER